MFVFCSFVYFLSGYLQVGIDKGEGSVTVCLFYVCLSTSSLSTSRWVYNKGEGSVTVCLFSVLFVYFLSGYLQVGIDKGEGSVTVCLFLCLFVYPPGGTLL